MTQQSERHGEPEVIEAPRSHPVAPAASPPEQPRPSLLVIVRHGESLRNTFDVHAGLDHIPEVLATTPDHLVPLTPQGERQAIATGQGLVKEFGGFDLIFHSPWVRTTETVRLIVRAFPNRTPVRRNLFLTEQHFGQLDPALWPHRLHEYAAAYRMFEQQREIMGKFYCRPPDGESWADVCIRTHQFLGIIFRPEYTGKRVLVVTHGVTQQSFRYHLEDPTEEELVGEYQHDRCSNCGTGAYTWQGDTSQLQFWNKVYY